MTVTLVGYDTTVTCDGRTCRLRFRGSGTGGSLRSRLGELHVPVTALAGIRLRVPGVLRPGRLTLIPRTGADPFTAVAGEDLADDVSPFGIEYSPDNEPAAVALARRLKATIARSGLAAAPAEAFLVEFTRLPVTARASDGWAEFDGERVTLLRFGPVERTHTMPLAALRSVRWVDGRGPDAYLRFNMIGDGTGDGHGSDLDPRRLHHETAEDKASTLVLAAVVTAALRRFHGDTGTGPGIAGGPGIDIGLGSGLNSGLSGMGTAEGAGPPHGLRVDVGPGGTVTRLYGLGGEAEFDGTAVTVRTHGTARRIPLEAIDELELGESRTGVGYVRVRLAGAEPADLAFGPGIDQAVTPAVTPAATSAETPETTAAVPVANPVANPAIDRILDPVLDVNTLCHGNEAAALEFTLRVTEALRGVVRVPDRRLLAAAGPPADIADALARASVRVRGLVPELAALPSVLRSGERVRELDLAVSGDAGLLVVTGDRLLFLAAGQPYGDPLAIPLSRVTDVRATWDGGHVGRLRFLLRGGDEAVFDGVHDPARFRPLAGNSAADAAMGSAAGSAVGSAVGSAASEVPGVSTAVAGGLPGAAAPLADQPPGNAGGPPGEEAGGTPREAEEDPGSPPQSGRAEAPGPPVSAQAAEPVARKGAGMAGMAGIAVEGGAGDPAVGPSHQVERALLRMARRPSPIGNPRALRADVRAARSRAGERARRRRRRELDDLLEALPEAEEVYELDAAVSDGQDGLLLLTDQRLLFLSGDELLSIPMDAVVKVAASDPAEELIVTAAEGPWFRFAEVPGAARFARLIEARARF